MDCDATNTYLAIPGFSRYGISREGIVVELSNGTIQAPTRHRRNYLCVELYPDKRANQALRPAVSKLVLSTYKPLPAGCTSAFVSVNYLDGDKANLCVDNLEWEFGTYKPQLIPGLNISHYTFTKVPGLDRLEINGIGQVKHRGVTLNPSLIGRYYNVTVHVTKTRPYGVHYLLALTFLEHPVDVSQLIVNHKNGNTTDNALSNLEWESYSGNSVHAYETGLRTENKPVLVMDVGTREVMRHYSIGSLCRDTDLNSGTIWNRLRYNRPITPYMGYYIKYEDDDRVWPDEGFVVGRRCGVANEVKLLNLESGNEQTFASAARAAEYIGVDGASLNYQLKKPVPEPYYKHFVKYANDITPWPEIPKTLPDRLASHPIAVSAKNIETGEVAHFESCAQAAGFFETNATIIHGHAKKDKPVPFHNSFIRFTTDDVRWPESDADIGARGWEVREILLKNIETGVITEHATMNDAAAFFTNCHGSQIRDHALRPTIKPFRGYYVRFKTTDVQWPDDTYTYSRPLTNVARSTVSITNKKTGETLSFPSILDAAKQTGIKRHHFYPVKSGESQLYPHDDYSIEKVSPRLSERKAA